MTLEHIAREDGHMVRQYEYDDRSVLSIDFGASDGNQSVDVVDGTVIVVDGDDQYEFDLPAGTADANTFIKNGVLTIELEDTV